MYNALFFRILNEKKPSLYVGFGFQPSEAFPPDRLASAKNTLYDSTISVGKQLVPFLRSTGTQAAYPELHEALDLLEAEEDESKKFGKWIVGQDCEKMRILMIKLEALAAKQASSPIAGLQGDALAFINAYRFYGKAHEILYRVPDCPAGGSRLRPRKRTSSRRRHKRRITRASHRHRKSSHRTRIARKKI